MLVRDWLRLYLLHFNTFDTKGLPQQRLPDFIPSHWSVSILIVAKSQSCNPFSTKLLQSCIQVFRRLVVVMGVLRPWPIVAIAKPKHCVLKRFEELLSPCSSSSQRFES